MTTGEAIGGETAHGRTRPDEDALAVLGVDQALPLEDREGVADRHPGDPVVVDELSLRGELLAFPESPTVDGVTQLVGDLSEDRTITRGVEITEQARGKRAHVCTPLGI